MIYGSSPAALTAAIEAQRHGKSAVIVCPETRIGGLTTGGLGQTDIGNKDAFGGLALQFYRDVADWYRSEANWKYEKREDYMPDGQCADSVANDSMWTFEPSAALAILERWERQNRLKIFRGEFLDRNSGIVKDCARISAIKTLSGKVFRGGMFADGLGQGWQSQLYVREGRRMIGDYVETEHDVLRKRTTNRPVAMAAYGMDSHNVRRYVDKKGFVRNEGNIEDWRAGGKPYPIDYGAILPKKGECENLFVPVCVSASHMAFGSIRMAPVFFALGQVAGAAAALSINAGCAAQDLEYAKLRDVLVSEGQVVSSPPHSLR